MVDDPAVVRVLLDGQSRLGAKIKSFQHRVDNGLGSGKDDLVVIGEADAGADAESLQPMCIMLTEVSAGGEADRCGLKVGDRLVLVDDTPVESFTDYRQVLRMLRDSRPLNLTFVVQPDSVGSYEVVPKVTKSQQIFDRQQNVLFLSDRTRLEEEAFHGVCERLRPVYWRILLNYLPVDKSKWKDVLKEKRELYQVYKKEFLKFGISSDDGSSRPSRLKGQGWWEFDDDKRKSMTQQKVLAQKTAASCGEDGVASAHPLELSSASPPKPPLSEEEQKLHQHDVELRETIWKDVQRTHPGFHFFADARCDIMERILFIFAKLNPGIEYVQGMNEVVAPILFVFGNPTLDGEKKKPELGGQGLDMEEFMFDEHYEVDTFFCFCNLMGELRDLYMQGMDSDHEGIRGRGLALMKHLKDVDPAVYQHLTELEINPQYFALRWLTTLLSREMMLPDTVRLWDSLFADPKRFTFLLYVCCSMISLQRENILASDFSGCLQILQKYPPTDLHQILLLAEDLQLGNVVFESTKSPQELLKSLASSTTDFLRSKFLS
uniref:Rab-GAP TBC domain-containing protein n=1 Tax=Mucochytrium quahogii TaxID=96639 RepID=A0A7S2RK13_9STRA|mmetsp:Transcript_34557/g.55208  ORF Transcript_34557/g.55208 Transcript_34557/m.55208 type:complete len:548 (+) Transcript_34557:340-1983(+)|eukprot:CAMPEP_0203748994 /NCGR_PEP_ID=MMETSP0098-20131031/3710_1 /ASSEMBLY_ACC=CAM_ASM_000208 /TAXON_ID=96639 /ORGANISM=" , Strain NY0313808BC1" /LENGTH=547 /DNA_ID=CAMNT_0050637921 /DNA_START=69 /DNA_END=1712 /DNA_ORIENTATION=-